MLLYPPSCQLPVGLRYWPNFITEAEEAELIQAVDGSGSRPKICSCHVFGTDMHWEPKHLSKNVPQDKFPKEIPDCFTLKCLTWLVLKGILCRALHFVVRVGASSSCLLGAAWLRKIRRAQQFFGLCGAEPGGERRW